jgi:hypothetical protein
VASFYTKLDRTNAHATVRFSDRSKFGAARIWLPDRTTFPPSATGGWSLVVRVHGGNGNNQGDIDPDDDANVLLMMINELGAVVVSINWQDNGFYQPLAQDPRALFFPDGLLEPALIVPWLLQRADDPELFGNGGFITTDPDRIAMLGVSDGGWRAALIAYVRPGASDLANAIAVLTNSTADPGGDFPRANVLISVSAHFDVEHFWMAQPVGELKGWSTVTSAPQGATQIEVAGPPDPWRVGHELFFPLAPHSAWRYLVTAVAGSTLTLSPPLRDDMPVHARIERFVQVQAKYSEGGYSWLGAPMFRAGLGTTWASFSAQRKREASLWAQIAADNPRVQRVRAILLYRPSEPYVTNDDTSTGWRAFVNSSGANPRYQDLHGEGNGFALGGLLTELGFSEGVGASAGYLLRAGGAQSNPVAATRFGQADDRAAAVGVFLRNHGW